MLKSCTYCGKIHDRKIVCTQKQAAKDKRMRKNTGRKEDIFRWGRLWKNKAEDIKKRDNYLCQVCIRGLYGTEVIYNPHELSVHHIISLSDDFERRLEDDNLITLCRKHHEMAEGGGIPLQILSGIAREQQGRLSE